MPDTSPSNERTLRHEIWRRYKGMTGRRLTSSPLVRQRVTTHAYDAWSVNVLILWKHYKRTYGNTLRGQRALIRYLDYCERLEREAFAEHYKSHYGTLLPHDAACASILRPAF